MSQYLGAEKTKKTVSFRSSILTVAGVKLTSNALSVVLFFVTVHPDLVTPDDSLQTVLLAEPLGYIGAELHADTALAGTTARLGLRIGPKHLHHEASLAGLPLLVPVKLANVVQRDVVIREETTVQNEVLLANQSSQRQSREAFREQLEGAAESVRGCYPMTWRGFNSPLVVFVLAFAFKAVSLVHIICLMVAPVDEEAVGPHPLVRIEQQSDLSRPRSSVDKVTVKQIVVLVTGESV